ncbi:hypothetical protein ACVOMT_18465 [Sphingomonas panni]
MWYRVIEEIIGAMLVNLTLALAESLIRGIAVELLLVSRVARCNDRIRRPIPGT